MVQWVYSSSNCVCHNRRAPSDASRLTTDYDCCFSVPLANETTSTWKAPPSYNSLKTTDTRCQTSQQSISACPFVALTVEVRRRFGAHEFQKQLLNESRQNAFKRLLHQQLQTVRSVRPLHWQQVASESRIKNQKSKKIQTRRRTTKAQCCRFRFPSLFTSLSTLAHTLGFERIHLEQSKPREQPKATVTPDKTSRMISIVRLFQRG